MVRRNLRQQVDKILGESGRSTVSVIVQSAPEQLTRAIEYAAVQASMRRSTTSANHLLPRVRRSHPSLSNVPQVPWSGESRVATRALKAASRAMTRQLARLPEVSGSRLARRGDLGAMPRALELAGGVVFELLRDDLAQLAKVLPPQASVFPNRTISSPPRMRSGEPSREVSRRTRFAWGLETTGALACWGSFGARGQGVKVAVLDTGVEARHPDIEGKVLQYVELDRRGKKVKDGLEFARDPDGHGTHVCGTIAGGNASGRWIGMAPEAKLLVAKVLGPGGGTDEQILRGMQWAMDQGADVINMSLGGLSFEPGVSDTYTAAIVSANESGIPVVAAIGNDGAQTSGTPGNDIFAFAVGATDVDDRIAAFSGGRTQKLDDSDYIRADQLPLIYSKPDLCAPGVDVFSCKGSRNWEYSNGSSMATPHVSGALALLLSRTGGRMPPLDGLQGRDRVAVLQQLLIGSVRELGENGQDHRYGWGRLDVLSAYTAGLDRGYLIR